MRADRSPAACNRVLRLIIYYNGRRAVFAVAPKNESLSVSNPSNRGIYSIYSIVIAAFSVFCLVEELRATDVNLNLSGREVTLEVGHVIHGIPQTELYI